MAIQRGQEIERKIHILFSHSSHRSSSSSTNKSAANREDTDRHIDRQDREGTQIDIQIDSIERDTYRHIDRQDREGTQIDIQIDRIERDTDRVTDTDRQDSEGRRGDRHIDNRYQTKHNVQICSITGTRPRVTAQCTSGIQILQYRIGVS